ncbi:porphobilinogen synthase [Bacteroidetes/Chlorobi group bacterium Naka2016]|jgi:porphobilinogen synthase|nr:MAG: porphobilinogen synthase [Bacteroidetes/Chlorobi group bacterium Naka2016]
MVEEFWRFRRLRMNPIVRNMVAETVLTKNDLIYPLFVIHGEKVKNPVKSMPGVYQMSIDVLVDECKSIVDLGIPAIILFGIPEHKDPMGSDAYSENGIIQRAVRSIKKEVKDLVIITDVCLCEYTSHGHCGILDGESIDNDKSLEIYSKIALTQVQAGADMVAPSDMMDGRVQKIRRTLDEHGYVNVPIMSYSAKFASSLYGPFREAAQGAPKFGDRKSHQMDYRNSDEAVREAEQDIIEGADIVMVKPAGLYLDIIHRIKATFQVPVAAYQVSGEYAMIKAAGANGWLDEEKVMIESLFAIKRAGADLILTYFAKDIAKLIDKGVI